MPCRTNTCYTCAQVCTEDLARAGLAPAEVEAAVHLLANTTCLASGYSGLAWAAAGPDQEQAELQYVGVAALESGTWQPVECESKQVSHAQAWVLAGLCSRMAEFG